MDIFVQQLINGLVLGSIYALVALGYTMVYGILGLINFAHGDVTMIGALVSATLIQLLHAAGLPVPVSLLLAGGGAVIVCASLGFSIERIAYRPLRNAPRLAPLITAIGVSILIQYSAALIWGKQYIALPAIITPPSIEFAGAQINHLQIAIVILAACIMGGLIWFIHHSRMGRAMRATEQNPAVASLMGVDTHAVIAMTFLLGSAIGAIAGLMVILYYGIGHYFMGFMLGLKAFTAAVLGGIGNVGGAVIGGLLLGIIESLAAGYIEQLSGGLFGSNYRDIFAFLVLILVLLLRPQGLLGQRSGDRA
jgi:branched-chain amino acid transport system permease protein